MATYKFIKPIAIFRVQEYVRAVQLFYKEVVDDLIIINGLNT